jgi:signal transduction histidine kinase
MFRNKEVQQLTALYAVITVLAAAAGFVICTAAGILVAAVCAALGAAFFAFTRARYRQLARFADQIDETLHSDKRLWIADAEEGELAILQSEIVKMTLRIQEQNEALRQEKGYLAQSLADIAHQLRTPLTSANLILSLLQKEPDEARRKALLRENQSLFAQMDWLVNTLLKLSRLDAGVVAFEAKPVAVKALVDSAAQTLAIPMELHGIDLKICVPEKAVLRGDAAWLSEALQNILKNCMENAGDGARIEVSCEDNPLYTEVSVHDSGKGFDSAELPHLFDRFYRGKTSGAGGYGIGLALCRSIITKQGGSITAKNHPQGGAVFAMRFPK